MDCSVNSLLQFSAGICTANAALSRRQNVRIGKLDNGLTYYIHQNSQPANRADFYIAQKVAPFRKKPTSAALPTSWNTCVSMERPTSPVMH